MKRIILLFLLVCLYSSNLGAQEIRSEQDCESAIPICSKKFKFILKHTGEGFVEDINKNYTMSGWIYEQNSIWLKLTIQTSGFLGFNIIPPFESSDFDFAVFNLTTSNCSDIQDNKDLLVASNFRGSVYPNSITGLNNGPNQQDSPMLYVTAGSTFYILINNFSGTTDSSKYVELDFSIGTATFCGIPGKYSVSGTAFADFNSNCSLESFETPLSNQMVVLTSIVNEQAVSSGITDENGFFRLSVNDTGEYKIHFNNPQLQKEYCSEETLVIFGDIYHLDGYDLPGVITDSCKLISLYISSPEATLGSNSESIIELCNNGSIPIDSMLVYVNYSGSCFPIEGPANYSISNQQTIAFPVKELEPFECSTFKIKEHIEGSAIPGSKVCRRIYIKMPQQCDALKSKVIDLELFTSCNSQMLCFNLKNTSMFDMTSPLKITYLKEAQSEWSEWLSLKSGVDTTICIPDFGYRDIISISSSSLLLKLITLDECERLNEHIVLMDINNKMLTKVSTTEVCQYIQATYDSNNKTGFPSGIGLRNNILSDQQIKYQITFQNPAKAPVYNITIQDTLNKYLDETSVTPGISSHPYLFYRNNNVLTFSFPEINLPSKESDEKNSQGFIEFYVNQKSGNPDQYAIRNEAAIYFDWNDPVFTRPHVYHVSSLPVKMPKPGSLLLIPNPSDNQVEVRLLDAYPARTSIYDLGGRLISDILITRMNPFINTSGIRDGIYIIRAVTEEGVILSCKLLVAH